MYDNVVSLDTVPAKKINISSVAKSERCKQDDAEMTSMFHSTFKAARQET